jgi:hypothetical protein
MTLPRPGLLVAFAVVALAGLFFLFFEPHARRIDLPPTGAAATNRLYLLELALKAAGQEARSHPNFTLRESRPGRRDTVVLRVAPEAMGAAETDALLAWVRRGGHLLLPAPAANAGGTLIKALGVEPVDAPFEDPDDDEPADDEEVASPAEQRPSPDAAKPAPSLECTRWRGDVDGESMATCLRFSLKNPALRGYDGSDALGYRIARRALGEGVVTIGGMQALDNAALPTPAGRELAQFLLAPRLGEGRFHLVYGTRVPPLPALLWRHGWRAVVPALLALVAWLAWRTQRIGPVAPVGSDDRRALLEHVRASGRFAWRRGQARSLYQSVRDHFLARLARRRPALAALEGEARVAALAEALGVDASRVRLALAPVGLHQPHVFIPSIATLARMGSRL